jgi:phosphosulfolactate synthase (CoM biosynthesis protein A)/phosphosulfolactate phosphohydrolase-like enzyme
LAHPFEPISFPALPAKPRRSALTSVLDKGLGAGAAADLAAAAGEWIDVVKLGWASARLTAAEALRAKVAAYQAAGIRVCTGGTFLEVALAQGRVDAFLASARGLGCDMVEVSNGVHPMSDADKLALVRTARAAGFTVWSEVGKKDPEEDARLTIDERIGAVERELEAGADKVVLEARESGTVGIYDKSGKPATELIDRIAERCGFDRLIFEAPLKAQQVWMIRHFGPLVNLGNVAPDEAIPLATLRTGLRGDTFADFQLAGIDVFVELGINGALQARERGGVVVVIDALRASATIVAALAAGMASVKVVATPAECVGEITAGERGGKKLAHCKHGNSPLEILRERYTGKQLVLTSTNCAEVLLTAAGPRTKILVGTTLNAAAVAAAAVRLAGAGGGPITLLQAGRNNQDAIEDALAAGAIFHAMRGVRLHAPAPPTSTALESEFFHGDSGQNLAALGYAEDVRYCARLDEHAVVPVLQDGLLVTLA